MAFLSRLMGLFGGRKADPAPAPAAPPPARNPRAAPTPPVPAEPRIFVGWTEMIDAKGGMAIVAQAFAKHRAGSGDRLA